MSDDDRFFTSLLYEDEGSTLDFKSEQYHLATNEEKGELIKDILAFTNAWRHADAYILIGVKENPNGRATVVGITDHLEDANLQQLVNSKTNQPVTFSYRAIRLEGKNVGVLHIPVQDRPRFITKRFGKISENTVYLRRGSSTAVALPDEIARMGAAPSSQASPLLELLFADTTQRRLTGHTQAIHGTCLDIRDSEAIPDYKESSPSLLTLPSYRVNTDFLRDLADNVWAEHLCTTLQFAIINSGSVVAMDVRVELTVQSPHVVLFDEQSWPKEPESRRDYLAVPSLSDFRMKVDDDITVQKLSDCSLVKIRTDKIQPKETKWIDSLLYLGSLESGDIVLDGKITADNVPTPQPARLKINCTTEHLESTWRTVVKEALDKPEE